ncbi:MAG: adenosine deaminase [Gemmatimonadaceae bacterium]
MTLSEPAHELLRRLPKAELHCHLDGSLRPATLLELGAEYGVAMPAPDAESLANHMLVNEARSLEHYLERFAITLSVMQTWAAIERIAFELAEDAWRDGTRYIEVRYSPVLNTARGLTPGEAVEAALRGLARAESDFGVVGRVIVCAIRSLAPRVSLELAELAVAFRGQGVVGFDLAGGERDNPAHEHAAAFEHAHRSGLPCTCHAGEGEGAASVHAAVHACGADRIGHATRLIEDEALTNYVKERHIPLEICLTSNVQTGAAPTYETHPLRAYFDRGLNVVLNTDNRLMSGVTLTDEYAYAARHLDFTLDELATIALNGFESAFLPAGERAALIASARRDIALLLDPPMPDSTTGERSP